LAILFVLAILPFSVAVVSNVGESTTRKWNNSMEGVGVGGVPNNGSYWDTNGGMNFTQFYDDEFGTGSSQPLSPSLIDCSYIVDGICQGLGLGGTPPINNLYRGYDGFLPMTSSKMYQSHNFPNTGLSPSQEVYRGESGSQEFSWVMNNQWFSNIEDGSSLDAIAFTMADKRVSYLNESVFSVDIGFSSCITFIYENDSLEFCGDYETDNSYCMDTYVGGVPSYARFCYVGIEIQFDFTNFETLEIDAFNRGNWSATQIKISFEDLYRDDGLTFGSTALPFAGSNSFDLGIEHKTVNPKEAGFLIKGGTLLLSGGIILFAIASTPYWDPLKQSFRGSQ
jgi:hypothetical protein